MPLTMNIGLSKKVGEANFGSRGASVNFAVEVESNLIREPEELREKIRYIFGVAREAVEEELRGDDHRDLNGQSENGHNGNGQSSNGNGRQTNGRSATSSQVRAIHAIAGRQRLDLPAELRSRFSVDRPDELSISEASELIDAIKPESNGSGGRR